MFILKKQIPLGLEHDVRKDGRIVLIDTVRKPGKEISLSWWDKKSGPKYVPLSRPATPPASNPPLEKPMPEPMARNPLHAIPETARGTVIGPSVTLRGELAGDEDLVIEGQFDGTLRLGEHCVTIGAQGQVKAEIQATRVIVQGAVTGNITARERIEIRKTGRVLGDLMAAGIAIEDGAYFKGSIEILRDEDTKPAPTLARAEPVSTRRELEPQDE